MRYRKTHSLNPYGIPAGTPLYEDASDVFVGRSKVFSTLPPDNVTAGRSKYHRKDAVTVAVNGHDIMLVSRDLKQPASASFSIA